MASAEAGSAHRRSASWNFRHTPPLHQHPLPPRVHDLLSGPAVSLNRWAFSCALGGIPNVKVSSYVYPLSYIGGGAPAGQPATHLTHAPGLIFYQGITLFCLLSQTLISLLR